MAMKAAKAGGVGAGSLMVRLEAAKAFCRRFDFADLTGRLYRLFQAWGRLPDMSNT